MFFQNRPIGDIRRGLSKPDRRPAGVFSGANGQVKSGMFLKRALNRSTPSAWLVWTYKIRAGECRGQRQRISYPIIHTMSRPRLLTHGAALVLALIVMSPAAATPPAVSLVSQTVLKEATAAGESGAALFSGDGRFVFFLSDAPNLVANDPHGARVDLFRRDLSTGTTISVSAPANAQTTGFGASADGRWVAFASRASNLVAGDVNGRSDVFLRDLDTGGIRLVSATPLGRVANGDSAAPVISADGRFVLFESNSSELAKSDVNLAVDVFLHEVATGVNSLVSARTNGSAGDLRSSVVALSADGEVMVFRSEATDLVSPVAAFTTDLYVRHRLTGKTQRIILPGVAAISGKPAVHTYDPVLSPDGRVLAFRGDPFGTTLASGVWWFDLEHGTNVRASGNLIVSGVVDDTSGPALSADGRTLAFEASPGRIAVWNADTGLHTLDDLVQTVPKGFPEPESSLTPVLSTDASLLTFQSYSPVPAAGVVSGGDLRLYVRRLATGETWTPFPGLAGAFDLTFAAFSPDGHSIQFQTAVPLPGVNDVNRAFDLVLAPVALDGFKVLSEPSPGIGIAAGSAPSSLGDGAFSDDGRFIVFSSFAEDLVSNDGNGRGDVFVRDTVAGTTRLVSVGMDGRSPAALSYSPRITGDGRFVVFVSGATNLAEGDVNIVSDVYVRDLVLGTTVLASARDGDTHSGAGAGAAGNPVISGDGRYVAFESRALDLVPGTVAGAGYNVFLRDLAENRTYWLSSNQRVPGAVIAGVSSGPMISRDGQTVAFLGGASVTSDLYVFSVPQQQMVRVAGPSQGVSSASLSADGSRAAYAFGGIPSVAWRDNLAGTNHLIVRSSNLAGFSDVVISADGSRVAFASKFQAPGIPDNNGVSDVFAYDIATGILSEVSGLAGTGAGVGNGAADSPALSPDGRRLAFHTHAGNLAGSGPGGVGNVFVRDLTSGVVALLSHRAADGGPGDQGSSRPIFSGDGRIVAFVSAADDLVPGDQNAGTDVYTAVVPDFTTVDADADGLPDAWEIARFGNLLQTGEGDFDHDGSSNRSEFIAGTDPRDAQSVFRASAADVDAAGVLTVTFKSEPGVTYQLQYSATLDPAAFVAMGGAVAGTGGMLTLSVAAPDTAGFARLTAGR